MWRESRPTKGTSSRSSTCGRSHRSTGRHSPTRCVIPGDVSSCTKRRHFSAWVLNLRRASPSVASMTCKLLSCGSAGTRPPTRRRGSKSISCPTSIACSTWSTAHSRTETLEADVASLKQFKLPDVGEGLTEAEIVHWHVGVGDSVAQNQTIVEIETAKALVELPSPFEGVVSELLVAEGTTIEVGTPIIIIDVAPGAQPPLEVVAAASSRTANLVGYGPRADSAVRRRPRAVPAAAVSRLAPSWPSVAPAVAAPDAGDDAVDDPGNSGGVLAKPPIRKLARD